MADVPHYCSACGEIHGGSSAESPEVKVAKINADRDIQIARLARSEAREETAAEVEQTEIAAEAAVDEAVVKADVLEEIVAPPEPAAAPAPEPEPELEPVEEMPPVEEAAAPPETADKPAVKEKAGTGWWDAYQ